MVRHDPAMTTNLRPLAVLLVVPALALTGCESKVDPGKAEKLITGAVTDQVGARVKSVECPSGKVAKKGDTFTCKVTGIDGTTGDALVTEKDDKGNVHVDAPFVHVRNAERLLVTNIKKQTGVKNLVVKCPEIIVGKKGDKFTCQSVGDGQKVAITATQTDAAGGLHYELGDGKK